MSAEFCVECEEPMILVERASGETFLSCQQCGGREDVKSDGLVDCNDFEGTTFTFGGQGAKPQGLRYNKNKLSRGRKKGQLNIQMLCQNFNVSPTLQQEVTSLFERVHCRNLDAASAAAFLAVIRGQQFSNDSDQITLRQISSLVNIPLSKIASCLKYVENLLGEKEQRSNGAIVNTNSLVRSILPQLKLHDPFLPGVDITQRVLNLTERIIQLVQRRSNKNIEPNFVTIAASYLAWQSCFFYKKAYHGNVSIEALSVPGKISTLEEYLTTARVTTSESLIRSVRSSYLLIYRLFLQMLKKMPWIPAESKKLKTIVAQYLEEIIDFQTLTCDVLNKEADIKRQNEPVIYPVIPRELTAEEEAVLDVPELSEKDLPEEELSGYLRSAKEVDSLKRWMDSSSSESERI